MTAAVMVMVMNEIACECHMILQNSLIFGAKSESHQQ